MNSPQRNYAAGIRTRSVQPHLIQRVRQISGFIRCNGNLHLWLLHLKMMLLDAAKKGNVAAIGDCSGAFYQAPLDPTGENEKVYIEPPPEAGLGPDVVWEAVSAFPGLKGAPKAPAEASEPFCGCT